MPLFDAYIFVDWSARNRLGPAQPTADAIWVGELERGSRTRESYFRTRSQSCAFLEQRLLELLGKSYRVLVGFDFPYGYPHGFASCLSSRSDKGPWLLVWETLSNLVVDKDDNTSNRFEVAAGINKNIGAKRRGPFWGCPAGRRLPGMKPRSPGFPFVAYDDLKLSRLRISEARLPGVQESWKLLGIGSVGSQALLGIPRVYRLRTHEGLSQHSMVWPFETGFSSSVSPASGPFILHAEIWPGIVKQEVAAMIRLRRNMIRDQAQVRCLCEWARNLDRAGQLARFFERPTGLTDMEAQLCDSDEGWILGGS